MTQSVTDVTTRDFAIRIDDAAGLLAQAEHAFHNLAVLSDAINALVDDPELGRGLARIANEMSCEMAGYFEGYKDEYNAECRRLYNAEQSSQMRGDV